MDVLRRLRRGELHIPHTSHLLARFDEIERELGELQNQEDLAEFIPAWLGDQINEDDPFHRLVLDCAESAASPAGLLDYIVEAVSQPDVPPDVTDVRIMSLHKSKGLSSPVVIIAGCVEGLLPAAPDPNATPAENRASLEEQRRLFFVGLTRVKADLNNHRPGVLILTSSRTMSLGDAMQSGIRPARVQYGIAHVHASRFIRELGPVAPAPQRE